MLSRAVEGHVLERRLLDTIDLFTELPDEVIEELRGQATLRDYERNELLFAQGDPATELFVVQSGRVAIATRSSDGRETVVAVLEEGSLFGEMPLFDRAPRMADARALVHSRVAALGYKPVLQVLQQRPELLWVIVRILAQRLRATDEALADAVLLDVPARTAKRLLEIAGEADDVRLPVTQEELAAMVGASRERVNKALALFTRLGWVEVRGRGHYRFVDREALENRANL